MNQQTLGATYLLTEGTWQGSPNPPSVLERVGGGFHWSASNGAPHAPAHASAAVVSIVLQCPLPWVGHGDHIVATQLAAHFVRRSHRLKLNDKGYYFLDKAILLQMLDTVVAKVDFCQRASGSPLFRRTGCTPMA